MTKYIFIVIFNIIGINLMSQNNETINKNNGFSSGLGAVDYSFNLGSQVGSSFNNSYYLSNYFSPNAKINLTNKFSIVVGVGASFTQMHNVPVYNNEFNIELANTSQTSLFTYASGIYKLNQKVNINATILLEEAMTNIPGSPTLHNQYKDVSLGINYNVNKHFTINAQMQFSDRPYNSRYGHSTGFGTTSPFGFSPFY